MKEPFPRAFYIIGLLLAALFFLTKPLLGQEDNPSYHFFAVHCEPTTANPRMFNALSRMVGLADTYLVKLTIEFTPQWAEMILKDKEKLALVRSWQKSGHEIGAHHHPVQHKGTWDGYTSRKDVIGDARYRGTMDDFINMLNELVYPEKIRTLGSPDEDDWVRGVPYRTEGFEAGGAASLPTRMILNETTVHDLGYGYLGNRQRLMVLKNKYRAVRQGQAFGVVTHTFNYLEEPKLIEAWFKFIKEQDPSGRRNYTVSEIMEEFSL